MHYYSIPYYKRTNARFTVSEALTFLARRMQQTDLTSFIAHWDKIFVFVFHQTHSPNFHTHLYPHPHWIIPLLLSSLPFPEKKPSTIWTLPLATQYLYLQPLDNADFNYRDQETMQHPNPYCNLKPTVVGSRTCLFHHLSSSLSMSSLCDGDRSKQTQIWFMRELRRSIVSLASLIWLRGSYIDIFCPAKNSNTCCNRWMEHFLIVRNDDPFTNHVPSAQHTLFTALRYCNASKQPSSVQWSLHVTTKVLAILINVMALNRGQILVQIRPYAYVITNKCTILRPHSLENILTARSFTAYCLLSLPNTPGYASDMMFHRMPTRKNLHAWQETCNTLLFALWYACMRSIACFTLTISPCCWETEV